MPDIDLVLGIQRKKGTFFFFILRVIVVKTDEKLMIIVALERLVVSYLNHIGLHSGSTTYQLGNLRKVT